MSLVIINTVVINLILKFRIVIQDKVIYRTDLKTEEAKHAIDGFWNRSGYMVYIVSFSINIVSGKLFLFELCI